MDMEEKIERIAEEKTKSHFFGGEKLMPECLDASGRYKTYQPISVMYKIRVPDCLIDRLSILIPQYEHHLSFSFLPVPLPFVLFFFLTSHCPAGVAGHSSGP